MRPYPLSSAYGLWHSAGQYAKWNVRDGTVRGEPSGGRNGPGECPDPHAGLLVQRLWLICATLVNIMYTHLSTSYRPIINSASRADELKQIGRGRYWLHYVVVGQRIRWKSNRTAWFNARAAGSPDAEQRQQSQHHLSWCTLEAGCAVPVTVTVNYYYYYPRASCAELCLVVSVRPSVCPCNNWQKTTDHNLT